MRIRSRAFTLIELMICLAILAVTFAPFVLMTNRLTDAYRRSILRTSERAELERLAFKIKAQLRLHPDFRIADDNLGATWLEGGLTWKDGAISLRQGRLEQKIGDSITHFSLHRSEGRTYLNLVRSTPNDKKKLEEQRLLMTVEEPAHE